ncbi:hypothetical protein M2222_009268 [Bradyrhizobium elkanii]|nr:hypothetical protein [Bradyrhizobium elkanii]MCS3566887.1 hypothetical protein [Bradyrhizobium elkanii]MCW2153787.1 hypothetical protein [Bradyrhizobium elkanii]MCW2380382.1 hypothetical protein [Bradyrhizobium elkanii]
MPFDGLDQFTMTVGGNRRCRRASLEKDTCNISLHSKHDEQTNDQKWSEQVRRLCGDALPDNMAAEYRGSARLFDPRPGPNIDPA